MCGLVGMAGMILPHHKKMFREMLIFDQIRGMDSTGVAVVYNKQYKNYEKVHWEKAVGSPTNLWDSGDSVFNSRGIVEGDAKVLLGHNRHATVGEVNAENAHPFTFGNVTGAHNGSLEDWDDLEGAKGFEVDSMALINDINAHGIEKTWGKFLGAAALTWWDDDTETLNFVRNFERPLWFARSTTGAVLFWASEKWMISVAAARHKVALKENENKEVVWFELPANTWYSYKVGYNSCTEAHPPVALTPKPAPVVRTTGSYGFQHSSFKNSGFVDSIFVAKTGWKKGTKRSNLDIKRVELRYPRRNSRYVGPNKFEEIVRFTLFQDNNHVGILDVCPQNKAEFNNLMIVCDTHKLNQPLGVSLQNKPRVNTKVTDNNKTPYYVCSASSINFGGLRLKEEETKEEEEFVGRDGGMVSKEEFQKQLKIAGDTCCYCDATLNVEDHTKIEWLSFDQCLCPECRDNWGYGLNSMLYAYGGRM